MGLTCWVGCVGTCALISTTPSIAHGYVSPALVTAECARSVQHALNVSQVSIWFHPTWMTPTTPTLFAHPPAPNSTTTTAPPAWSAYPHANTAVTCTCAWIASPCTSSRTALAPATPAIPPAGSAPTALLSAVFPALMATSSTPPSTYVSSSHAQKRSTLTVCMAATIAGTLTPTVCHALPLVSSNAWMGICWHPTHSLELTSACDAIVLVGIFSCRRQELARKFVEIG